MPSTQKILICATDQNLDRLLQETVSLRDKYTVVSVRGTDSLIRRVYDEMPHVVIADIHSSDVASFDMCAQMKFDIILGHIPLIILTETIKAGKKIDCGADLYLHKPVNPHELVYHLERIISRTIDELDINPLTHLPGNRSTVQTIESLIADKKSFAICCVDLKNLKVYNDAYGVHRGDFLIRETAEIIKRVVGTEAFSRSFVGHLGGDDFIVVTEPELSEGVSEKIIELFDKSVPTFYELADRGRGYMVVKGRYGKLERHSFVSLSIAIITNEKIRYEHVAQITKAASQIHQYLKHFPTSTFLKDRRSDLRHPLSAMEQSPPFSIRRVPVDVRKEREISQKSDLLSAVMHFLKSWDIDTYCQPIVSMRDQALIHGQEATYGYEALSRFPNPDGTFWDPLSMFRAAREANVIKEFDVLCAKRALLNTRGFPNHKKLFINLNRETVIDPRYMAQILDESPLPLDRIVVELTEQSLLVQTAALCKSLEVLRSKGVEFAIDDMGGGSVSLRESADLRPDYIKYDGSLIRAIDTDETKQKILFSLMVFAKGIEARTTAEGIETRAEMEYLQRCGIDFGQGYYIAKPAKVVFEPKLD